MDNDFSHSNVSAKHGRIGEPRVRVVRRHELRFGRGGVPG
jgi:hypothetical protein